MNHYQNNVFQYIVLFQALAIFYLQTNPCSCHGRDSGFCKSHEHDPMFRTPNQNEKRAGVSLIPQPQRNPLHYPQHLRGCGQKFHLAENGTSADSGFRSQSPRGSSTPTSSVNLIKNKTPSQLRVIFRHPIHGKCVEKRGKLYILLSKII